MKVLLLLLLCASSSVLAQSQAGEGEQSTTVGLTDKPIEENTSLDLKTTPKPEEKVTTTTEDKATTEGKEKSTTEREEKVTTEADLKGTTPVPEVKNSSEEAIADTPTASTEAPSDTTPAPLITTTTVKPPTPPKPDPGFNKAGTWEVNNHSNHTSNTTCLKVEIAIQLVVQYNQTNYKLVDTYISVPTNATVESPLSQCSDENDTLVLTWGNGSYALELVFITNGTNKYSLHEVVFNYTINAEDFPDAIETEGATITVTKELKLDSVLTGTVGKSYKCDAADSVDLNPNVKMSWKTAQVQAFMTGDAFGSAEECATDDKTDDIVPIAVGCALAALVIIVLIAYMIGRRRSRQKGYQSV